eukprot:m.3667 g.3667  ORF g.3667 m.3667 type:complete len:71 (+) comp3704_c0_seq1:77-289(+)
MEERRKRKGGHGLLTPTRKTSSKSSSRGQAARGGRVDIHDMTDGRISNSTILHKDFYNNFDDDCDDDDLN